MFKAHGFQTKSDFQISQLLNGQDGFVGRASQPSNLVTVAGGATNVAAAGDPIGEWFRDNGSFNWSQSVSGSRPVWARMPRVGIRNLLQYTEQFSNAFYGKSNVTITANTTTAPDGAATADTATDSVDGAPATHAITSTTTNYTSGVSYTLSLYAKQGTLVGCELLLPSAAFGGTDQRVRFNISTGTATTSGGTPTSAITSVGNGWYRCSVTATAAATTTASIQIRTASATTAFYQGTGAGTIFIWGAQLEAASSPSTYQAVTGPWDVTQSGQPSVWLPYHGGSAWLDSGATSFGSASLFADAGQAWTTISIFRTLGAAQTLLAKAGATEANRTFQLVVTSDNRLSTVLRGALDSPAATVGINDGRLHAVIIRWNGTIAEAFVDGAAADERTVGAAAQETQNIIAGARTASSPTVFFTGRLANFVIPYALTNAEIDRLRAYIANQYGVAM